MTTRHKLLLLLIIVGVLYAATPAFALDNYTQAVPYSPSWSTAAQSTQMYYGANVTVKVAFKLLGFVQQAGSTATHCALLENTTFLRQAVFVGKNCTFAAYDMEVGHTYRFSMGSNSSFVESYATASYPQTDTYMNYTATCQSVSPQCDGRFTDFYRIMTHYWIDNSTPVVAYYPNITFVNRTPADITTTALFTTNATFTYGYNTTGLITPFLSYYLNSTIFTCTYVLNGTCQRQNGTEYVVLGDNTTVNNTFLVGENSIYPSIQNANTTAAASNVLNITGTNNYIVDRYDNMSTSQSYGFYEVQLNSTGSVSIYYFNSSYDFNSNPDLSPNTHLLCNINGSLVNHSHSTNNWDNLCAFSVNSSGFIDTVKATTSGGFMLRGNTQGVLLYGYAGAVRNNVTMLTTNNGAAWTAQNITLRTHVHQFGPTDRFCYAGQANYTTGSNPQTNGTLCDNLDISIEPQTAPNVYVPNSTAAYGRLINITYEASVPTVPSSTIQFYNITLRNSDLSFNATIRSNNSLNTSYVWDAYTYNLSVNTTYYVRVTSRDNNTQLVYDDSEPFTFYANGYINLSARDNETNATISNFSVTIYNDTLGFNQTVTANGLYAEVPIVRGNYTYQLIVDAVGYALLNTTFSNATNYSQNYSVRLLPTNSIYVNVFDESTLARITGVNTTVRVQYLTTQYDSTNTAGLFLFQNLTEGNWTVNVIGSGGYSSRVYYVQVVNRTSQFLNAYLSPSSVNVIFTTKDRVTGNAIPNATFTVQSNINGSFVTVGQTTTDAFGQAVFSLISLREYQFIVVAPGYFTKTGLVNTIITSYTVLINANNTQSFTSYLNDFSYKALPTNVGTNYTTFSLTTSSPQGAIQWFALVVKYNGTTQTANVSGSPSGGTASLYLNLTNVTGSQTVTATYYVKSVSITEPMVLAKSWLVYGGYASTNYTFVDFVSYYASPTSPIDMATRGIIVTILAVLVGAGSAMLIAPAAGIIFAATIFLFAGIFGWLSIGLTIVTVGGLLGLLLLGGRT